MEFRFDGAELKDFIRAPQSTFLLSNGLGGYMSVSAAFSAVRCDQGILVSAVRAPNKRINMVHRLSEKLVVGEQQFFLSSQDFSDGSLPECGREYLISFTHEYTPCWTYRAANVTVTRQCAVLPSENTAAVLYSIENTSNSPCTMEITPFLRFNPKEEPLREKNVFSLSEHRITSGQHSMSIDTNGALKEIEPRWQILAYPEDAKDGRPEKGFTAACCAISLTTAPGEKQNLEVVFSTAGSAPSAQEILRACAEHLRAAECAGSFTDPVAQQLAMAADAYIVRRDSTKGKTILAGYPLFSDWGRDTMIALHGCALCTRRFDDAKSILRTFLTYEKDGLVPNLFPEGDSRPVYNTADAALLLIDAVWQYVQHSGDTAFVAESYPTLARIVDAYRCGTLHAISMDEDGLIRAGGGLDQVTWMDVCVNGILPTPRHGKPVEINAYWYNALCIMAEFSALLGLDSKPYTLLAEKAKESFVQKFYMPSRGWLRDVISGTKADEQLRCNQIWAVSMSFTMLSPQQEKCVVDAVYRHLYTPKGLRTLSPEDPEYHSFYGGDQQKRDMAYHQGTAWVFPMGAYYLACLKTRGSTPEAARHIRRQLDELLPMLREGCLGQLPEIYDGDSPSEGKGCYAQAWSVGEMLRVFDALRRIEDQID